MVEENISQEFRPKNIDETRNYFIEVINQNELVSKKYKKSCTTINYIEHLLILASVVLGCISISAFAFLVGIPIGITISAVGLKICLITAGTENYKSIIKKKREKHDEIVLLTKTKLNTTEVLFSRALNDLYIIHDEFVLVNNLLREYNNMKEEFFIKYFDLFTKQCCRVV